MGKRKSEGFEESLKRLNIILDALDDESTTLKQSVALYEEALALIERCASELRDAQGRLKELRRRADGVLELLDVGIDRATDIER